MTGIVDEQLARLRVRERSVSPSEVHAPSPLAMVREWHEKFGQLVRDTPDASATYDEIAYRWSLIREELAELLVAMGARDVVAVADALADELYVLYGVAVSYGIDLDAVFAEVHRSNMTKTFDPS